MEKIVLADVKILSDFIAGTFPAIDYPEFEYHTTDFVAADLIRNNAIAELFLSDFINIDSLSADDLEYISRLFSTSLSLSDKSALFLAQKEGWILSTSDCRIKSIARSYNIRTEY